MPFGHSATINSAVFSNNGKYIVSASEDSSVLVWDVAAASLLQSFAGHNINVNSARFSPDDNYIISCSKDSTARIWSLENDAEISKIKHYKSVVYAALINDGKTIVTETEDSVFFWQWQDMRATLAYSFIGGLYNSSKNDFTFYKDSTLLYVYFDKGLLKLKEIKTRSVQYRAFVMPVTKRIITCEEDGYIRLYDFTGVFLREYKLKTNEFFGRISFNESETEGYFVGQPIDNKQEFTTWLHAISFKTNQIIDIMESSEPWVYYVAKDTLLLTENSISGTSHLVRPSTKDTIRTIEAGLAKYNEKAGVVLGIKWNAIELFNLQSGTKSLLITKAVKHSISFSDSSVQFTSSEKLKDWNLRKGLNSIQYLPAPIKQLADNTKEIPLHLSAVKYSIRETAKERELVRVSDGKVLISVPKISSAIYINEKGNSYIVSTEYGRGETSYSVFSLENGGKIADLTGIRKLKPTGSLRSGIGLKIDLVAIDKLFENTGLRTSISAFGFDEEGKFFYVINGDFSNIGRLYRRYEVYNVQTGELVMLIKEPKFGKRRIYAIDEQGIVITNRKLTKVEGFIRLEDIFQFQLDKEEKVIACQTRNAIQVYDIDEQKLIVELPGISLRSIFAFSDDGLTIYVIQANKLLQYETYTGKLIGAKSYPSFPLFGKYNAEAFFSGRNQLLLIKSDAEYLSAINLKTLESLRVFFVDSTNWLVTDEHGRFDGTEQARSLLYFVCGREIIDLQQFKELSWEPGLANKLVGISTEPFIAKGIAEIKLCGITPIVEELGIQNNKINFKVTEREGGIGEVLLYINGKQVNSYTPAQLSKSGSSYLLSVDKGSLDNYIAKGERNEIEVKATTTNRTMVSRGGVVTVNEEKDEKTKVKLYSIAVGISQYKGDALKLNYAAKDAEDFSAALKTSAQKLFNTNEEQRVYNYTFSTNANNSWPSKQNIQQAFEEVTAKATANDIVIIFFAGHGVVNSSTKLFYYLTQEASAFDLNGVENEVAISTDELNLWMRNIKAQKQLLILDACNSGQAISNLQSLVVKREIPAEQQRALDRLKDRTGTYILTASASGQSAYETSLYNQGLLTYSLLYGIKLGAALSKDNLVDVNRLFNFAADKAKELSKEIGGRQDPQTIGTASFDIGIADKEVRDGIKLSLKKKIFKRSLFIQDELLLNDELQLGSSIDAQLNETGTRGQENPIAFVADNALTESYSIRGKYEVKGDMITAKVLLVKGQSEIVGKPFMVEGKKEIVLQKVLKEVYLLIDRN